jgi:hypothetical protein
MLRSHIERIDRQRIDRQRGATRCRSDASAHERLVVVEPAPAAGRRRAGPRRYLRYGFVVHLHCDTLSSFHTMPRDGGASSDRLGAWGRTDTTSRRCKHTRNMRCQACKQNGSGEVHVTT